MSRRLRRRFQIDFRSSKGKRPRIRKDMIGEPTNFQHISHGGDPDVCGGSESDGQLKNQLILVDLAQKQRSIEEAKRLNCTSDDASLPTPQAVTEDASHSRQLGVQETPKTDDGSGQQQQQQQQEDAHDGPPSPHKEATESHSLPLPLPSAGVEKSQKPRRSLRLKKKKKIRNDMIGLPYNFQHVSHAGFDRDNNFSQFNIEKQVEDQIRELFKEIGLTKTQMSRPRTREFVYSLLERHGVLQEARRESQLLSSQKRLSGQTAEVMSGGGQAGKGLGNEETENDGSQVSEGPEYTGSGHEDEVMLVASLDLSDLEVQSCPQRAAPQDQSQEPVKKYRHRAAKRQAPRPPSQVGDAGPVAPPEKVIQTAAPDLRVSRVCPDAASGGEAPYNPAIDKKVIHCIVSEGPVVHTVTSYVISSESSAGETQGSSSTSPQDNNSSVISIERAPTPPPPRKSLSP
ncbi:LOW QUALITY PROTEIN: wiskott-Aldrich syndrome protein homolog [Penaeus monodon]|uniref:LOW QUALITY PROTEIN: wiskott-Aldrich syndrome protein homolog n=1 Tax=Penaeus monodon TaxID=6687 RepID=UPI0018A74FBB|nr:LOW QUALITY PROTEIN: wiskott-Aldrich syndrome protein homolog [Penaeus monodon]